MSKPTRAQIIEGYDPDRYEELVFGDDDLVLYSIFDYRAAQAAVKRFGDLAADVLRHWAPKADDEEEAAHLRKAAEMVDKGLTGPFDCPCRTCRLSRQDEWQANEDDKQAAELLEEARSRNLSMARLLEIVDERLSTRVAECGVDATPEQVAEYVERVKAAIVRKAEEDVA